MIRIVNGGIMNREEVLTKLKDKDDKAAYEFAKLIGGRIRGNKQILLFVS